MPYIVSGRQPNPINTSSLFTLTGQVPTNKPPSVSDDFNAPRTAIKGEQFVLECIVYGRYAQLNQLGCE